MINEISSNNESLQVIESSFFEDYLKNFKLPHENIIVSTADKNKIADNLPELLNNIPESHRMKAHYLAKFISSVAIGRFDSALNDLWNEVIEVLRDKVDAFGLDIFFKSASTHVKRNELKTKDDLKMLKDIELIRTCRELEIISDVTEMKLKHILNMRNHIGGSHPTRELITPHTLLGWLEDCVVNIFSDETSTNSLMIKKIINGIDQDNLTLDKLYLEQLNNQLKGISVSLVDNLLKILFKKYIVADSDSLVNNIRKISPTVWKNSSDNIKYKLGIEIDAYSINLEKEKENRAKEFFEICAGGRYLSKDLRNIILNELTEELRNVHFSYNNFYEEVSVIRKIMMYIKESVDIPEAVTESLINAVLMCRVGNEYGISRSALPYYNDFFEILNQGQVKIFINSLYYNRSDFRLNSSQEERLLEVLIILRNKTYTSERIKETIEFLTDNQLEVSQLIKTIDFKHYIDSLKV
ncbi:hypothetical protein AMBR_FBHANALA_01567 [Dolosigranulum pigrum]|nr:hypothetical protein AMBR_FBHANALA_01567 [Dolosigranulum pigrum]